MKTLILLLTLSSCATSQVYTFNGNCYGLQGQSLEDCLLRSRK